MKSVLQEYKPALIFLVVFVGLYLLLNTLYGVFITAYHPAADPITRMVSNHVAWLLNIFHDDVVARSFPGSQSIRIMLADKRIINVFEGCNSVNVMIVYVAFLFAFKGKPKDMLYAGLIGIGVVYLMNLLRVMLLFEVALNFPDYLYFFHKFLFTGFIYLVVFVMWYYWIRHVRKHTDGVSA